MLGVHDNYRLRCRCAIHLRSSSRIAIQLPKQEVRVHTLIRLDTLAINHDKNEIRAFMTVRDEISRLPRTIEHHRKLGVARFFVVDNGSHDGCKEFLLAQPDCHVFATTNSHSKSGCGAEWWNALLDGWKSTTGAWPSMPTNGLSIRVTKTNRSPS